MGFLRRIAAWAAALLMLVWSRSCRYRMAQDPRPALRAAGHAYVFALLHAHQLAAVFANDEPRLAAMLSRSADGDLLAPSLRLRRIEALRGSTRTSAEDKGGRGALTELAERVSRGIPALLAVDGPRGPRMRASEGIVTLARLSGVPIIPVSVATSRRRVLGSWDRFIIALPFSRGIFHWGTPIEVARDASAAALEAGR